MINHLGNLAGGLLLIVAVIATAYRVARSSQFYRRELAAGANRELALDGLRGVAALMVATHHAELAGACLLDGEWGDARSPVLQLFGPSGVILFFMLTGYLFWSKARKAGGKINPLKLWPGRLCRIGPLYLASLLCVLLLAELQVGGTWLKPANWQPLLRLFALGALNWQKVGPVDPGDYNGVVWTLAYDRQFYLVLPLMACLAVGWRTIGVAGVLGFLFFCPWVFFYLCPGMDWVGLDLKPYMYFIFGMLSAVFLDHETARSRLSHPISAALAILIAAGMLVLNQLSGFSLALAGALFPIFLVAAAGNQWFDFLSHPAMRCLGMISFSYYLLHDIIFRLEMRLIRTAGWNDLPHFCYWLLFMVTAVALTGLCSATYRWIEFPFLSLSHKPNAGLPKVIRSRFRI